MSCLELLGLSVTDLIAAPSCNKQSRAYRFSHQNAANLPIPPRKLALLSLPPLARLQPKNRYVLLDMQRADTCGVPEDNLVGLQVTVVRAMPEDKPAILRRAGAVLSGPEHGELREAFMEWVKWSWAEDYRRHGGEDEGLLDELNRLVAAREVDTMSSLMVKKWEERERQKEAQILARGMEFTLERMVTRRFNASTGERLSALLAGVSERERLAAVVDAVIECGTGEELLAAAKRIVDEAD